MTASDAVATTADSAAVETAASKRNEDNSDPLPHADAFSLTDAAGNDGRDRQHKLRKMVSKQPKHLVFLARVNLAPRVV